MYLKRIVNNLKILEEIGNLFIKDQIGGLLIKRTLSATNIGKRGISNLNIDQNLRIK